MEHSQERERGQDVAKRHTRSIGDVTPGGGGALADVCLALSGLPVFFCLLTTLFSRLCGLGVDDALYFSMRDRKVVPFPIPPRPPAPVGGGGQCHGPPTDGGGRGPQATARGGRRRHSRAERRLAAHRDIVVIPTLVWGGGWVASRWIEPCDG